MLSLLCLLCVLCLLCNIWQKSCFHGVKNQEVAIGKRIYPLIDGAIGVNRRGQQTIVAAAAQFSKMLSVFALNILAPLKNSVEIYVISSSGPDGW